MKIAIIGVGHMGAWLINNLKTRHNIGVFDSNKSLLGKITGVEILNEYSGLKEFAPEILINAVSIQNTVSAFEAAALHLPAGCILCDVASVKSGIPQYYAGFSICLGSSDVWTYVCQCGTDCGRKCDYYH